MLKKHLPAENSAEWKALEQMQPSISADNRAASVFQFIEAFIEIAGVHSIFLFIFTVLGLTINALFFTIPLGIMLSAAIQGLLTSNLRTKVVVENNQAIIDQMGDTKENLISKYNTTALLICAIAMMLNGLGGYLLLLNFTFKADKTAENTLKQQNRADLDRINGHYTAQFSAVALIDSTIAQTQNDWAIYAQRNPSQRAYANKKLQEFVPPLVAQRDSSYSALISSKKAEIDEINQRFDVGLAYIRDLHAADYSKQWRQEFFALLISILASTLLLYLVWKLRVRATLTEIRHGVSYTMELSNDQNGFTAFWYAISDGLNGRVMNWASSLHETLKPETIKTIGAGAKATTLPPPIVTKWKKGAILKKSKKLPPIQTPTPIVLTVTQPNNPVFPAVTFVWIDNLGVETTKTWDKTQIRANLRNFYERSFTSLNPSSKDENLRKFERLKELAEGVGYEVDAQTIEDTSTGEIKVSVNVSYDQTQGGTI